MFLNCMVISPHEPIYFSLEEKQLSERRDHVCDLIEQRRNYLCKKYDLPQSPEFDFNDRDSFVRSARINNFFEAGYSLDRRYKGLRDERDRLNEEIRVVQRRN